MESSLFDRLIQRYIVFFFLVLRLFRESTGTSSVNESGYGDPVQRAEAMAFRRACARFGLGLHLYHEEL
ncbi:putative DNA repair RAD52-like protein [Helianthus annuus]|nr:putative DNA repair RAD52-like protein [Helianthus annuus]